MRGAVALLYSMDRHDEGIFAQTRARNWQDKKDKREESEQASKMRPSTMVLQGIR
jgi:hypothetical protein